MPEMQDHELYSPFFLRSGQRLGSELSIVPVKERQGRPENPDRKTLAPEPDGHQSRSAWSTNKTSEQIPLLAGRYQHL
jgi:hypothetical protein